MSATGKLGGREVARVGLGCMGATAFYSADPAADEPGALAAIASYAAVS